jgi:hypothetical protein
MKTRRVRKQIYCSWDLTIPRRRIWRWQAAFWDVARCSLIKLDRRFRDANCLHQGDWWRQYSSLKSLKSTADKTYKPLYCVTAIHSLDLSIVSMFCNRNVSRDGSSLVIRWTEGKAISKNVVITKHCKVKWSRYTPWRHMGGQEV